MQTGSRKNKQENLFKFLTSQYSGLGVSIMILSMTAGMVLLFEPYLPDIRVRILASAGSVFLLTFVYGSIARFAYERGGSPLGQLFRIVLFLLIAGLCLYFGLIHWAYGLICIAITVILMIALKEECRTELISMYSTRDQVFNNDTVEKGQIENAVSKLFYEIILGPGYCQRVIDEHINDLRLAIALGKTEIEKGRQETTYMDMQRVMNMIAARLRNLSTEESLQQLETITRISELQYKIHQLNAGITLSRVFTQAQKHELLLKIAQCRLYMEKLSRAWQHMHQGYTNSDETGFEE